MTLTLDDHVAQKDCLAIPLNLLIYTVANLAQCPLPHPSPLPLSLEKKTNV